MTSSAIDPDGALGALAIPLDQDSDDFGFAEYFLQVSCRTSRAKVEKLWGLSQGPEASQRFQERSQGLLVIPAFVSVQQLDHLNSVQGVCERGFKIDASGMLITVGNFVPPGLAADYGEAERLQEKFTFEAFLCHVCVGKSYLYTLEAPVAQEGIPATLEGLDTAKILHDRPADYDSVYIHRKKDNFFEVSVCCWNGACVSVCWWRMR